MAVIVGVGSYLSFHYRQLLKESRDRVDQTYETLRTLDRRFESIEGAETGQRGFIITGEESYLATSPRSTQP